MKNKPSGDVKSGTEDEIAGAAKILAGKVKEGVGKAIGNDRLQTEGDSEQIRGSAQKKIGEIKKVFGK